MDKRRAKKSVGSKQNESRQKSIHTVANANVELRSIERAVLLLDALFFTKKNFELALFILNGYQAASSGLARYREGPGGQDHGDGGERPDQEGGGGLQQ